MATKIVNKMKSKVRFDSLKPGDTFLNPQGEVRIKIVTISFKEGYNQSRVNAICLLSGGHRDYCKDQLVTPVDLTVEVN